MPCLLISSSLTDTVFAPSEAMFVSLPTNTVSKQGSDSSEISGGHSELSSFGTNSSAKDSLAFGTGEFGS